LSKDEIENPRRRTFHITCGPAEKWVERTGTDAGGEDGENRDKRGLHFVEVYGSRRVMGEMM
jgi:hypothetical protein